MRRRRDARNIIIVALCLVVVGMGIGFAYLQTALTIEGTANLTSATWKIEISSITACTNEMFVGDENCLAPTGSGSDVSGTGVNNSDKTKATFVASLTQPEDSVTYKVVVSNSGTLDAKLSSLSWGKEDTVTAPILFSYNNIVAAEEVAKSSTKTFYVTVSYDNVAELTSKTTVSNTLSLNFVQATIENP